MKDLPVIEPKEIAGIMRLAAPFLGPVAGPAAYLLGTAKQTGRISPVDLALTLAPTVGRMTLPGEGKLAKLIPDSLEDLTVSEAIGNIPLPFTKKDLGDVLVGRKRFGTFEGPPTEYDMIYNEQDPGYLKKFGETTGIFGKGGEMFKLGKDNVGLLDTKVGQTLFGKPEMVDGKATGSFVPSYLKIGSTGVSLASLLKDAKTPEEAGNALVEATGNSDDYEAGVQMFSTLPAGIFDIPQQFRLNSANGGIMRTNYANGSEYITKRPDFFKDLFLEREGGGGKDYMIPERAADFKKYYRETEEFPNLKVLDAPEGVNIFTSAEQAKKMNLDIAKELEAERILPSVYDQAMRVIDAIQDIDDEETSMKMIADVNSSFNKTKGTGLSKAVNSYYRIIEKYGYLLDDKKRGLGSMQGRKAQQANGGIMRTNYARGSDDDKPVLPEDPTKPINPFGPKPIKPLGDMKMAEFDLKDYMEEFERVFPNMIEKRGTQEYMDMLEDYFRGLASKDKEGIMMAKEGGRANLALGTKPTTEESGLGGLPIEADMRYTGGFMPYGEKEKADDVPARLSKNEFVFTADAVRAAGGGSVNEGAKKMYTAMKQLEKNPEAKGMMA